MTIRLLRTLVAVADAKTFSAAADSVHVTHAAVSQQMQTLEAQLGVALFDRKKRTPELTSIAHQVVAKARKLVADYDALISSAAAQDDALHGTLRLGAIATTLTGLTPQAMAILKARAPSLRLHIRPGLTMPLLADIERGNLDAAIITRPTKLPPGIAFQSVASEPLHLIASLHEPGTDPLALLRTRPYIRFNRSAVLGALIESWIIAKRLRVTEAMELGSAEAITSMVEANLGVSIVPRLCVPPEGLVPVKRISLGPDAPARVLGLAYAEERAHVQTVHSVHQAFQDVIGAGPDA